ncbi:pentatricopeptide repeat-containing protein [Cucumis melo var. makuwa]|uniref:Pentatricopeptide repeat-containing protein n=1 Tax=Cucumis melo var. makuwa TaxID=1194695 RepID=A0A5D3CL98_CUCMM|nr:pentatricopeptide repeat-containing protein [Cucumis melo var. makuwa]TYK12190.1 pentatricopeptide repeat-containing protein [Cucumis melo var. makuwa]
MVRLWISAVHQFFPINAHSYISKPKFLSTKHQFLSLLKHCSSTNHLFEIHAQILVSGRQNDSFLTTELLRVAALSPSRNLSYGCSLLFHCHFHSATLPWNLIIRGYSSSDSPREAISLFGEMRRRGVIPNNLTFPFLLKACATLATLQEGKQFHAIVIKCGLDLDVYVRNTLIHFYGSCKRMSGARKVFDEMTERTLVSWNAIITACVENFFFDEAIDYFLKMGNHGFEPDETTMVVILSACAELGNLSLGRWVHSQVVGRGMVLNVQLGTAFVDMYAKSGDVGCARRVFNCLKQKSVWTWSAMILGLAQHGFANEAIELFTNMKSSPIVPNYVTFVGVLCACSHAGLVDKSYHYFNVMERVYGIKPMMIHYGLMVDVLGRAGQVKEAYELIMSMPVEPDPVVWRTLLSACSGRDVNGGAEVAEEARKRLLELEPKRGGNVVMVANKFAEVGMWKQAADYRRTMKDRGIKKMAGESCIELGGSLRKFFSGFNSRAASDGIYDLLDGLNLHMQLTNF